MKQKKDNTKSKTHSRKAEHQAVVDDKGRLTFPEELVGYYGLKPGAHLPITEGAHGLIVHYPVTHLRKVYIEPTNQCNLSCRMCIRHTWNEQQGQMTDAVFTRIIENLRTFSPPPTIIFGGFGEPLSHPHIADMAAKAKELGSQVELITNATLLSEDLSRRFVDLGIDVLWVSLDGTTAKSYGDVRQGAVLPEVINNVAIFRNNRRAPYSAPPHIGIVFVAMKENIKELPSLMRLGTILGADRYLITNVLPYTETMSNQILYSCNFGVYATVPSLWTPYINVSLMDMTDMTRAPLFQSLHGLKIENYTGGTSGGANNYCPFIESGSTSVSWDGNVSPCLPLIHDHISYLRSRKRISCRHIIGNVAEQKLNDLWNNQEYVSFREKVQRFDFSPCTFCGGCELSEANKEDCFGNTFPTCGGCLWARGIIQCP